MSSTTTTIPTLVRTLITTVTSIPNDGSWISLFGGSLAFGNYSIIIYKNTTPNPSDIVGIINMNAWSDSSAFVTSCQGFSNDLSGGYLPGSVYFPSSLGYSSGQYLSFNFNVDTIQVQCYPDAISNWSFVLSNESLSYPGTVIYGVDEVTAANPATGSTISINSDLYFFKKVTITGACDIGVSNGTGSINIGMSGARAITLGNTGCSLYMQSSSLDISNSTNTGYPTFSSGGGLYSITGATGAVNKFGSIVSSWMEGTISGTVDTSSKQLCSLPSGYETSNCALGNISFDNGVGGRIMSTGSDVYFVSQSLFTGSSKFIASLSYMR